MKKGSKKEKYANLDVSVIPVDGEPETCFDLVNKYGTYEIQPTCDMQNEWPTIAQGCPRDYKKPSVKPDSEKIRQNDGR